MTIITNRCWGGFSLPADFCETYDLEQYDDIDRTDERLVNYVREHNNVAEFGYSKLAAVEIPDEATDWEINDYDGMETIIYVVDGKIHHA